MSLVLFTEHLVYLTYYKNICKIVVACGNFVSFYM